MNVLHNQYTKYTLNKIRENADAISAEEEDKKIDVYVEKVVHHILNAAKYGTKCTISHDDYSGRSVYYPLCSTVEEKLKLRFPDSTITWGRNEMRDTTLTIDWS